MNEGRRNWPISARRWLGSWFVERQIIVRANGRVRYLSISARAQAITAGSLFLVGAWATYATLGIVHQARVVAAKEIAIAEARDAYGRLIGKVDSYQATLSAMQEELEVRQDHLSGLFDEKRSLEAQLADLRATLDETVTIKGRLEAGRLALHHQVDTLAGELATSESVNRILADKLGQTKTRLTVVQNERSRAAEERVELDRKLWRADDEIRDALSSANLLNAELQAIAGDLKTVQDERRDLARSNQALRREVTDLETKLGRRYADIRAEMERRLKSLEDSHARDRLGLVEKHRREVSALETRQAQMAKAHQAELIEIARQREAVEEEHSRQVAGLEADMAAAAARLVAEREELRGRHEAELAEMAAAQAESEALHVAERDDMRARHDAELKDIAAAQAAEQAQQVAEIDALRGRYEARLSDIAAAQAAEQAQQVAAVDEMRDAYRRAIARREAEHAAAQQAWQDRRQQLDVAHEAALVRARGQRENALAALEQMKQDGESRDREAAERLAAAQEAWRRKTIALDAEQARAQRKLEEAHLARLDVVRGRQQREIAALVERHRQEQARVELTWLAERAGLVKEADQRVVALKGRHRTELAQLQQAHDRERAARAMAQAEMLVAQRESRNRELALMQRDYEARIEVLGAQIDEERRMAAGAQQTLRRDLTRRMDTLAAEKEATIAALRQSIDGFDSRELAAAVRHERELSALEADLDRERIEALANSERLWTERIEMAERTSNQEIARLRRTLAAIEGSTDETVAELSRQVDELESMRRSEVEDVRRKMEGRLAAADRFRREEIATLRDTMRKRLSTLEHDMRSRIAHVVAQKLDMEQAHRGLLTDLIEQTRENARQVESVIAKTGLDPDHFVPDAAQEEAVGGPFVAIGPAQLADVPIEQVARAVTANLARWRVLQQVVRQLPLSAPLETYRVTSLFGKRRDPFNGRWAYHQGVDFKAPRRTAVHSTSPGTVVHAGWKGNYGRTVEVDHGHGLISRYAHLHSVDVKVGQQVGGRARIGTLGSTGRSTGAHLHYEILLNGERYDPLKFLKAGKDVFKG